MYEGKGAMEWCLSKRKDTNFKANHNSLLNICGTSKDVCLSAKIRILKQITTIREVQMQRRSMFV